MSEQYHEMTLEKKYPSGADEWLCPVCGRRVIISWEPRFKRTVLEDGDPNVGHSGFKADQQMEEMMDAPSSEAPAHKNVDLAIDETRLAPWLEWLEESRFDDLWKGDHQ